jgi:hypothetical protein
MLLDIQWVGQGLFAVANVPGRIYAMNAQEACQWQELPVSAGFEPVLCTAVWNAFALLGRYGTGWAVSRSDGETVEIPISHRALAIGFTWFEGRYGIVCEKEDSPDQEVLVCEVSGALLGSAPLP